MNREEIKKKIKRKLYLIKEDYKDAFEDGDIVEYEIVTTAISAFGFFLAFILYLFAGFSIWNSLLDSLGVFIGLMIGLTVGFFIGIIIDDVFFED